MRQKETPTVDTRTLILDATEQIMLEEGFAAVTSRKVAAKAELKSKLLHYYFRTMDDLFIAVFQRLEDAYDARFAAAAASRRPLHGLWDLAMDGASGKLVVEFTAAALHRPAVRETIGRSTRRDRIIVSGAIGSILEKYGIDADKFPPKVVALLMSGIARAIAIERVLGTEDGHPETLDVINELLQRFEPEKGGRKRVKSAPKVNSLRDPDPFPS